ncbi:MAG: LysM peptidoglycan-binding domain-containing protein [Acidimicrobiales bacterium]
MAAVEVVQVSQVEEIESAQYLQLVSVGTTPAFNKTGRTLAQRRAARQRMIQRRRRSAIALLLVIGLVILAWPGHAFGGTTNTGLPTDVADSSVLAPGMLYIVQTGDTVTSIAAQINPVDPGLARQALVRELGSTYVVPGEHILIP